MDHGSHEVLSSSKILGYPGYLWSLGDHGCVIGCTFPSSDREWARLGDLEGSGADGLVG